MRLGNALTKYGAPVNVVFHEVTNWPTSFATNHKSGIMR